MGFSYFNAATLLLLIHVASCQESAISICRKDFAGTRIKNKRSNVKAVISDLVRRTNTTGFFAISTRGSAGLQDAVHGISYCRPDIHPVICGVCVNEAAQNLQASCPNSVAASFWYLDLCSLRFGPDDFIGKVNIFRISVVIGSEELAMQWLQSSYVAAVMGNLGQRTPLMPRKFAREDVKALQGLVVRGLAMCSPDQSQEGCRLCLHAVFANYALDCKHRSTCMLNYGSCIMQYVL